MTFTQRIKAAWDAIRGHYEATRYTTYRTRLDGTYQNARADISQEVRAELVRKSRYWEKNSPLVQNLASVHERYVVGQGLVLQPASSDPKWNQATRGAWEDWGEHADLSSRQHLATCQSQWARSEFVDGECFLLKTKGSTGRPRIQAVEGDVIITPPEYRRDPMVYDGIRFDDNGRPTHYYVGKPNARGKLETYEEWEAKDVEHIFEPDRPGQHRGIPALTSALNVLHDLEDLARFEMQAAKEAAAITNVLTNQPGEFKPSQFNKIGFSKTLQTATGDTTTETRQKHLQDILGARTVALKLGEKLEQFKSQRPGVVTMDYWRYLEEQVCTTAGIPHVLAHPDMMQGTVYRGALDMAAAYFRARSLPIAATLGSLFRWWVQIERLKNPAIAKLPRDWWRVSVLPPRAVNVDIGRNAMAMQTELACGTTNLGIVYGQLGLDWRQELQNLADQVAYAKSLGLDLTFGNSAQPSAPQPDEDDDPPPRPLKK